MKHFLLAMFVFAIVSVGLAVAEVPHLILTLEDETAEMARDMRAIPEAVADLNLDNPTLTPVFHLPKDQDKLDSFYSFGMHRFFRLDAANFDAVAAYDGLSFEQDVIAAELVYPDVAHVTSNDYNIYNMWGLTKMQVPQAWDLHHGDSEVIVTTIDTGCTIDHPDLAANIRVNPGEDLNNNGVWDPSDNNNVDDDGNGFIDDLVGWDFVSHNPSSGSIPQEDYAPRDNMVYPDIHGHGTHVMGSAAGVTNNSTGVAAASWNVKAMPVRAGYAWEYFGSLYGSGYSDDFAEGVNYAVNNGARVISISFGGSSTNAAYEAAVNYARANNVLVFASAGNNNNQNMNYPAGYDAVLAVAATDQNDHKASFSTYGTWVAVSAPGVDIWSTMSNNSWHPYDYVAWDGTSMASPNAAAVAGLLLNYNPALTDDELEALILDYADDIDGVNPSYQGRLGSGRINAYASLNAAYGGASWPAPTNLAADLNGNTGAVSLTWDAPAAANSIGNGGSDFLGADDMTGNKDDLAAQWRHQVRVGQQMTANGTFDEFLASQNDNGGNEIDEFLNYAVYRNGNLIASPTNESYVDNLPSYGNYEYYVVAIYSDGQSAPTPSVYVSYIDESAYVLVEDFDGGLPGDWSVETTVASGTWHVDFGGERDLFPTPYMLVDSDVVGDGPHLQERLVTPYLDLSDRTDVALEYSHVFDEYENEDGYVMYSINNGGWQTIVNYSDPDIGPETVTHNLPALTGQPNVRFSWYYNDNGSWGWYWGVDDVTVYAVEAASMSLTITPINTTVGPNGGTVTYGANLTNNTASTYSGLTYWTMATLPNGNDYGPMYTRVFNLNPNQVINVAMFGQSIPGYAPAGTYTHHSYVGYMPNDIVSDSFTFTKSGTPSTGTMDLDDWTVSSTPWPDESMVASATEIPTEFSVGEAYPNPFNPSTSLTVNLPQNADLTVTVYNISGQQVATLASGVATAGSHTYSFDASNLSSGLYFIRATVPGQLNQIRKVTLMK